MRARSRRAELGCGLDGLLRHRRRRAERHPERHRYGGLGPADRRAPRARYGAGNLERKALNKAALQQRMGLAADAAVPLFGLVGRMTPQKGVDLSSRRPRRRWPRSAQLAVLGSGDRELEAALREVGRRHPGRIAVRVGFDEGLAHLVEAGADVFLMPSRFEPCGLNQMYSQRYGTPPVAHATGGLADTIEDGVTGFVFAALGEDFLRAVGRAVRCYGEPASWRAVQRAGMQRDFSWGAAALRYAALYRRLAMRARA